MNINAGDQICFSASRRRPRSAGGLICVHGSCKIRLDNGSEKKVVPLEKPYEGLYVSNAMWREMFDFSPDAVLMVLASELYDEADYIRDYDEFLRYVAESGDSGKEV